jgi:hypothetical protein
MLNRWKQTRCPPCQSSWCARSDQARSAARRCAHQNNLSGPNKTKNNWIQIFYKHSCTRTVQNFSPRMPCQMGLRWYVRWQARFLIGQSRSLLPIGMAFERLKSPCMLLNTNINWWPEYRYYEYVKDFFRFPAKFWWRSAGEEKGRCTHSNSDDNIFCCHPNVGNIKYVCPVSFKSAEATSLDWKISVFGKSATAYLWEIEDIHWVWNIAKPCWSALRNIKTAINYFLKTFRT